MGYKPLILTFDPKFLVGHPISEWYYTTPYPALAVLKDDRSNTSPPSVETVSCIFCFGRSWEKPLKWDDDAGDDDDDDDDDVDVFMILLHTWICQKVLLLNSSPLNHHVGEYVGNFFKAYERRPGFRVIYQGLPRT